MPVASEADAPAAVADAAGARPAGLAGLVAGVVSCGTVAAAAGFLSQHYGGPILLHALLLGLAMNFLSQDGRCRPGLTASATVW